MSSCPSSFRFGRLAAQALVDGVETTVEGLLAGLATGAWVFQTLT